jgi:aryl-alcohol dehydrogenase-like predicted oxidoreductase
MSAAPPITRRPVPGTKLAVSAIALSVDLPAIASQSSEEQVVALLRRARAGGVTTFDLGGGRLARRTERVLARAFPNEDPELVVILRRSVPLLLEEGTDGRGDPAGSDLSNRLERSLEESADRLRPQKVGLLEWLHDGDSTAPDDPPLAALDALRATGLIGGRVAPLRGEVSLATLDRAAPSGRPGVFSGAFSLLETRGLSALSERAARDPTGFFARDPLGSGRLDGSRFARTAADRRPDVGPSTVRDLQREFDPVLRLGFLTEGRRRTLPQASVGFVLRWPWVCSALVPLPPPERLEEILAAERAPPVTDAEAERVLALVP